MSADRPREGRSAGTTAPRGTPLGPDFFERDAQVVACDLLGKVLCHEVAGLHLWAAVVETEAYYLAEKASHASLGYTEKRRALFMPPGTIYMYYARGGDSFNVSCAGAGNAVLVKAGWVPADDAASTPMRAEMARRVPLPGGRTRPVARLCSGQTLLCRALGLRVPEWDGVAIGTGALRLLDVGYRPATVLRTTRLGIPPGRDGHLPYRFVDGARVAQATRPVAARGDGAEHGEGVARRQGSARGAGTESGHTVLKVPPLPREPDWAALLGLTAAPAEA